MERTERIATSVTPEQKQEIRIAAAERGMTMSELIYELVEGGVEGEYEEWVE